MTGSLARALRIALRSPGGRTGAALLAVFAIVAVIGPWFLPDPSSIPETRAGPLGPGAAHPFGTDQLGRDVLSRTVSGARISLTVGIFAVAVAMTLGTLVGLVAGSVFVESVFNWPGLGALTAEAVATRDYPVLMGTAMLTSALVILGGFLTDVGYLLLDPRVRHP